jgi:hypothetical protein
MASTFCYVDIILIDRIHKTVFIRDSAAPPTFEIALEGFGLSYPRVAVSIDIGYEFADFLYDSPVIFFDP